MKRALVTGAGGFIGHHLVGWLKDRDHHVIGVDTRAPQFGVSRADTFLIHDIRRQSPAFDELFHGVDDVYALAADMGGMGFISKNHATIMRNNVTINVNTLEAARTGGVKRYLYASSACIYPEHLQASTDVTPLAEHMAYPAKPQDGYGWEKLYTEILCENYHEEFGLDVRIARLHNVYGPLGTWEGGREKAPAALCRKVAEAIAGGHDHVEIWGDGEQTRSFCDIGDCMKGLSLLMASGYRAPLNIGRDELVTINDLADVVMKAAGVTLRKVHREGPQGVRGRCSDNRRAREVLGWAPEIPLEMGIARTYAWVREQVKERAG